MKQTAKRTTNTDNAARVSSFREAAFGGGLSRR
nr:MAG TPA: hypothetical protein [Bacteriophage sp.]